jgi:two-component system cell cycle response regulator DivK
VGHSDADVLLHAVTDAILGAAGLPDIGELFPDSDQSNRGRRSADFLTEAIRQARGKGYELVNLDCVVMAQWPKLSPYKDGMGQMTKTVLVVEDNELNMKLFHDLLDAHGYRTLQTRSGMEALKIAREQKPDLILMDIQLPEVSGLEVTKWLKDDEALRDIPVVAVTAFAMKGDEERIRQGGCEAYISKPISIAAFLDTVRRYLGEA